MSKTYFILVSSAYRDLSNDEIIGDLNDFYHYTSIESLKEDCPQLDNRDRIFKCQVDISITEESK